jgi:hypothetical protein
MRFRMTGDHTRRSEVCLHSHRFPALRVDRSQHVIGPLCAV